MRKNIQNNYINQDKNQDESLIEGKQFQGADKCLTNDKTGQEPKLINHLKKESDCFLL